MFGIDRLMLGNRVHKNDTFGKCVFRHIAQIGRNSSDSKVHFCQFVGGGGVFLSVNRNIFGVAVMG